MLHCQRQLTYTYRAHLLHKFHDPSVAFRKLTVLSLLSAGLQMDALMSSRSINASGIPAHSRLPQLAYPTLPSLQGCCWSASLLVKPSGPCETHSRKLSLKPRWHLAQQQRQCAPRH